MLAPAAVDDREDDAALELAGRLLAELLLALGVEDLDVGLDLRVQTVLREVAQSPELLGEVLLRDRRGVDLAEGLEELVDLPLLDGTRRRGLDVGVDDLLAEVRDLLGEVLAVEHLAPFVVDDGALPVEDVVVLEDVLALFGIALLDLRLRREDGTGDHLRLERTSSGTFAVAMIRSAAPEPKRRMRSSVSER